MADEGRRREHAHVEAAREDPAEAAVTDFDFRTDGARGARLGGGVSRARRRAAGARAGEAGRALGAAAALAAGAGGAVRERAARPRRADRARADELAAPALLRVLRDDRLGAGHPRRAARGDAQPGRDPLARFARVDGARAANRRLGAPAARPAGGLARSHRGHGVDVDARRADRGSSRHRPQRRRVLGARALVGREGGAHARNGAAQGRGRSTELRMRTDGLELGDVAAVVATVGLDVVRVGRSRARARRARARSGRLAARRRGVRRLVLDLRGGASVAGRRRARRLARRQSAQVADGADGLLASLDVAARRLPRRRSRSRRSTCARTTTRTRCPTTARRSAGASARSSSGRCCAATGARGCSALLREHVRLAELFADWVEADPDWELCIAGSASRSSCSAATAPTRRTSAILERANQSGEMFLSHTKLDGRYVLRLAIGNARTTEADVRRAWDVLNREARA